MAIIRTSNSTVTIRVTGQGVPGPSGATAAHASTHSRTGLGGVDPVSVENLATAGVSGSVPVSDGAGGLAMAVPSGAGNVVSPGGETADRLAFFTASNAIDDTTIDPAVVEVTTNKNAASGYAGLDGSTKLTGSQQVYGSVSDTATEGNDTRVPSQGENDALVGTDGTPSTSNRYVTNSDPRNADSRAPTGTATGDLAGTYPAPTVDGLQTTPVSAVAPTEGQVLTSLSSVWTPAAPATGTGNVVGPVSAVDSNLASFDTTTGELIKDSGIAQANVELQSNKNAVSGYAGLDGSSKLTGSQQVYGTIADTATEGNDSRVPSQGENDALVGTDGTPSTSNRYVTDTDPRNTDSRAPSGSASGDLSGSYPAPAVAALTTTSGPQSLTVGAIADGQFLSRSGTTIIGSTPGGSGDVVGPASAVDGNIALYDGTSGKLIKDDGISITEANLISGVISGYIVTINSGDSAQFDISAGTGVIVDWTAPPGSQITPVSSGPFVAQVIPDITLLFTSIFINAAGAVVSFSGQNATPQQKRALIKLQAIQHEDEIQINFVEEDHTLAYESSQAILDYIDALGPISTGNNAQPAATDLTVGKTAGITTKPFFNATVDAQDPTNAANSATAVINPVVYVFQDGVGGFETDSSNTEIDPNLFDDGSGTLTTFPSNRYAVTRFAHFSSGNSTLFFVPQFDYSSLAEAISAVDTENFQSDFTAIRGIITTLIAVQGNTTDLTDTADALFVRVSNFGGGGSAGGGADTYLGLNDTTDADYAAKAGRVAMVNPGEAGLDLTQIDHTNATHITGVGTNTHAQIDTHIAAVDPHTGVLDLAGTRVMTGNLQLGTTDIENGFTAGGTLTEAQVALFTVLDEVHSVGFFGNPLSPALIVPQATTFDVAAGIGAFRTGASINGPLGIGDWPAATANAIPLDSVRFVGIEWNAGTPQVLVKTTNVWTLIQEWPIGTVTRDSDGVHETISPIRLSSFSALSQFRLSETEPFARVNGLNLQTSSLTVQRASGRAWAVTTPIDYALFDTGAADTFDRYFQDGGSGFSVELNQTSFEDQSFENGTGTLGVLTNNRFGVRWFYMDFQNGNLSMMYGTSNTNDAAVALLEEPPASLPPRLQVGHFLLGRVILVKSAGAATQVDDIFGTDFSTGGGGDGDVTGPTGGVSVNEIAVYANTSGKAIAGAGILSTNVELLTNKDTANGYPGLDGSSKITGSQQTYGTIADTACVGNDARLSDARTPTGSASGDLAGSYPGPSVAAVTTTSGPTSMVVGAVADGEFLRRSGTTLIGDTPSGVGPEFGDDVFRVNDDVDPTKQIAFQAAGITTATTRIITMPDQNVLLDDATDSRPPDAHTIAFHDTTATGAQLNTLVGSGNADALHTHADFADNTFRIQDNVDPTKEIAFEAATVATGTVRTIEMPDKNVLLDDAADSRPPSGTASGDLSGTYPGPAVAALTTTTGPTSLVIGAWADGALLRRTGATAVGGPLVADVMLRDGSVAMTGDLDLGANDILNTTTINGVNPSDFLLRTGTVVRTADQDYGNFSLDNVKTATLDGEIDNGTAPASVSVDFDDGSMQRVIVSGNTVITIVASANPKLGMVLRVIQDATGSRVPTFAGTNVHLPNAGVAPAWSSGANEVDIITFVTDGTNYFGFFAPNFQQAV